MATTKLNAGMRVVKYMLLIINFMFMLTATLLLLVGTTIQAIFGDFKLFIDDYFLSPPTLLVAIGGLMFLVSSFGCFGALKESTMLINIYGVFLFLIFILEISASLAAFLLQGKVQSMLIRTMNISFGQYHDNSYIEKSVDFVQSALECCGVNNSSDWEHIFYENKNHTEGYHDISLPMSCCARILKTNSTTSMEEKQCLAYYSTGCLDKMTVLISSSAMLISSGAVTVAFVQILGVFCAFMLAKTLRRNKSLREARRWQLQQSLGVLEINEKHLQESSGYTKLSKYEIEKCSEPVTYTASSPSVN